MAYDILEVEVLFDELNTKSEKTIAQYNNELASLRAGRANPKILDGLTVDYYGVDTPFNQVGNITVPEARILMITVWDNSLLKKVEKSIIDANLGITPNNDGKNIRLIFPEPTEERRRALVKDVKNLTEKSKVALRNIRRDSISELKALEKSKTISEDLLKTYEADVEKIVSKNVAEIEKFGAAKEKEVLTV